MQLKNYQEDKINRLKQELNELLDLPDSRICVFKAPTGSGKTLMVSEAIKGLVKERNYGKPLAFVWIAPRMLHGQSKEKLEKYYEDDMTLQCSSVDDLQDNQIQEKEILFLNWESLNKKNNVLTTDNEQDRNLTKIIENTKEEGRDVFLIIDESHHSAKTETAQGLINDIAPKVTLEVSATPHLISSDILPRMIEVDFSEVVEEGMIKKEVLINPEINKIKVGKESVDSLVIKAALNKRDELIAKLRKEKSDVNPLVLIQLPDSRKGILDKKDQVIKKLKDEFKISEENEKLAIWLSETKTPNLVNIEKKDNETEVLIFKQAIALGWDCPRAAILVLFREWKSITFEIQTVGRIMRMPEWRHYKDDALNRGYVFTNVGDMAIKEGLAKDYLTIFESKRNDKIYGLLNLPSIHLKRQRERTRLHGIFSGLFLDVATKNNLHKSLDLKPNLSNDILVNGKIEKIDKIIAHIYKEGILKIKQEDVEIQYIFDLFARENCKPFAPVDSSGRIKTALYKFFEKKLKIKDEDRIQKIVLSENNKDKIAQNIEEAKEKYALEVVEKEKEAEIERDPWNVPDSITYSEKNKETKMKKSIMQPYYTRTPSKPEKEFITLLENSKEVVWWFKNCEGEKKYFAVLYKDENNKSRGFYVDFIFKLKNGKIGMFDTKEGITARVAKLKAEALAKYIVEQNKKVKKLVGGILISKNNIWRYNDNPQYQYNEADLSDWKYFDFKKL